MVRQAALGVLLARPRVAEVDIEQVDLVVRKKLVDIRRVERDEKDVFEALTDRGLHGEDKCVLHALDGDQQHIRLGLGRLYSEFSLAAADLNAKLPAVRHQAAPVAAQRLRVMDPDRLAGLHPRGQIVSSSHSHMRFLLFLKCWWGGNPCRGRCPHRPVGKL